MVLVHFLLWQDLCFTDFVELAWLFLLALLELLYMWEIILTRLTSSADFFRSRNHQVSRKYWTVLTSFFVACCVLTWGEQDPQKWIIMIDGGGLCIDAMDCRWGTRLVQPSVFCHLREWFTPGGNGLHRLWLGMEKVAVNSDDYYSSKGTLDCRCFFFGGTIFFLLCVFRDDAHMLFDDKKSWSALFLVSSTCFSFLGDGCILCFFLY